MGAKAGLDVDMMLGAINAGMLAPHGTTRSWLPDYILKDRAFGGQLGMMVKDIDAALAAERHLGAPLPLSDLTGATRHDAVPDRPGAGHITAFIEPPEQHAASRLPRAGPPQQP